MGGGSYKDDTYWLHYQPFFPEHCRISADNAPAEEYFSWQGGAVHLDRFACDGAALTVILIHGAGGYGRMLAPLGALLRRAGHEVIAPDLPGYGLSRCGPQTVRYDAWVDLICALVRHARALHGRPVVLCGASLGGYLAYLAAARLEKGMVAGVIATTLADPRSALVKRQFARNGLMHALLPLLPLASAIAGSLRLPVKWFTRMDAMSSDSRLNRIVAADPMGGGRRVPVRFLCSIFAVTPDVEPEDFDRCEVLLLHPGADRWTGLASSQAFLERIGGPARLVVLENCAHFPIESPGFAQLEQEALRFLDRIASMRRSGAPA